MSFPVPLYPLVSSSVLVETFEEGSLISRDVNDSQAVLHDQSSSPGSSKSKVLIASAGLCTTSTDKGSRRRVQLAETGLNLYLQMLLKDNFCHADLHPGNIIVREESSGAKAAKRTWGSAAVQLLSSLFHVEMTEPPPRLVLLDAGMIAELRPSDQHNLVNFFRALTRQEGEKIGRAILTLSEQHTCRDADAFVLDMKTMFDGLDAETIRMHTAEVFADMIETLRRHSVTLKSTVSTIVVTTLVLEGWSSKLDPDLHILDTMRELLGGQDLAKERIGRLVDRICHADAPPSILWN